VTETTEPLEDQSFLSPPPPYTPNVPPPASSLPSSLPFSPDNHLAFPTPEHASPNPIPSTPIPTPTPNPEPTHPLQNLPAPVRRSQHPRSQNVRLDGYDLCISTNDFYICMINTTSSTPEVPEHDTTSITFAEANKDPGWRQAMHDEMTSI
jgi:hypothetical protein